ncbi:hypothetical protein ARMGADRAFT_1014740 [Armillaria gallica]|uniref:Uncharacterized protein n=1 Tax=Armillaria gallica TaxID=47427 RepID=A0A2H3D7M4_ARMGA|nr:hypothetical protein ARMGADRAFT_1014740 [Armillaria gallica]
MECFENLACSWLFVVFVRLIFIFKPFFDSFPFFLCVEKHRNANLDARRQSPVPYWVSTFP